MSAVRDWFAAAVEFTGPGGALENLRTRRNGEACVRISATGPSNPTPEKPLPELASAWKTWPLHSGRASVAWNPTDEFLAVCELPRFRSFECIEVACADR